MKDTSALIVYTDKTGYGNFKYKWSTLAKLDADMQELKPVSHLLMSMIPSKIVLADTVKAPKNNI